MTRNQSGSGADALRSARAAAYGPGATPQDLRRLRELEAPRAVPASARPPDDAPPPRRVGRLLAACVLAGALVGSGAGFAAGAAVPRAAARPTSGRQALLHRVVESPGLWSAADYYRIYPDDLPEGWGVGDLSQQDLPLTGSGSSVVHLQAPAEASALLVVPTCPSRDRGFSWVLRGGDGTELRAADGVCGRLRAAHVDLPNGHGDLTLQIDVEGPEAFAVAIFAR